MIAIDTNVLLRFLIKDEPAQSALAFELIRTRCTEADPGFVSLVAVAELAWALDKVYRLERKELGDALQALFLSPCFLVQSSGEVFQAVDLYRKGEMDFHDALIGLAGRQHGCATTFTFDRGAARSATFTRLSAETLRG